MAPFTLIVMGIILYIVNQRSEMQLGIRGLPWLDAPTLFVVLGGILFVVQTELKRRARAKEAARRGIAPSGPTGSGPTGGGEQP